jgi:hypothetical protein
MAILVITYLKYKGHLSFVNDSHMHNIVVFLFGFSVFWTYVWFSQFMLQWYANIPEDTMWFYKRFNVPLFKVIFLATFIINFAFPFVFLMKRRAKRNPWIYGIAAVILMIGHYLDFYFMVMFEPNAPMHHAIEAEKPTHQAQANVKLTNKLLAQNEHVAASEKMDVNAKGKEVAKTVAMGHEEIEETHSDIAITANHETVAADHGSSANHAANAHEAGHHEQAEHMATLGVAEIAMFLGFLGLFLYVVLTTLSKNRLVPIKSPFLDESLNYKF